MASAHHTTAKGYTVHTYTLPMANTTTTTTTLPTANTLHPCTMDDGTHPLPAPGRDMCTPCLSRWCANDVGYCAPPRPGQLECDACLAVPPLHTVACQGCGTATQTDDGDAVWCAACQGATAGHPW